MRNRFVNQIQGKIMLLILSSLLLSVITEAILFFILYILKNMSVIPYRFLYSLYRFDQKYGYFYITVIIFFLLFFLFVLLLSRAWGKDFYKVLLGTKKISEGEFDFQVPVYSNNELGEMAGNINRISEQLHQSIQEERRAVQAKNELITNVSHDLRTPLTSIMGYLRLIEEDRYKDEVELRYYVNIAYEKAMNLEKMVSDLFEYTRVNFGALRLNKTEIDLIQLLSQITSQFIPLLKEVGLEVALVTKDENMMIKADPDKLVRVFDNLISNAMKYGENGKKIIIRAKKIDNSAVVEVINYGNPIPSVDLPYIFNRFYRVEKSRSLDTGGTGLGLAIAKSIVDLHDGKIEVTSNEIETNFKITLPLDQIAYIE
ncbi:sensor histidine kinase [Heyndrickxia oleronia]|uniref:sensor histidine kinase n=1 Tax=Heyndrickxia oleronia TaxID=38875 RepID=UPI001B0131F0|nr:HAMP domain-containing sensor histidine kinase [Heyndrickxia oleronia]GIN41691.1 two-component sensor histidine kinase [Heyndrickxia oleronia]